MLPTFFQRESDRQARRRDDVGGHYDRVVLGAMLALICIGIVMVASSSVAVAEGKGLSPLYFLWKHLLFLGIGGMAAAFVATRELRDIERYSLWMLIACFVLLAMVFLPASAAR
ncbi:MAG: FtsW/RodA/SpoVE family cell cycle protein [Rhodanobacteraceae bacterium]|nr:FtsW/RodA/SpoVE family cell cycle protein [Rhodanobacteraceae bacterium]